MNLLIDYFRPPHLQRHSEYLTCIHENISNPLIKKIYVFISDNSPLNFTNEKIQCVFLKQRPTFKDLFCFCNQKLADQICIIANTDILFDETLELVKKADMMDDVLALTRWELYLDMGMIQSKPFDNATSQDVWIFQPPITVTNNMDFTLGKWGCDNKIAKILKEQGYTLRNPGLQIKTYHLHLSGFRTNLVRVPGPYLLLEANDNLNKETKAIEVEDFDRAGNPIIK